MSESRPSPVAIINVGIGGALALLALVSTASGIGIETVAVPFGPAGAAMHFALDPLAASFLFLAPFSGFAPLSLVGSAVSLMAADGFTLAAGLVLAGATSLRPATVAAICVVVALALLGPSSEFAAIRTVPPEGWRASAVLALTIGGAAAASRYSTMLSAYLVLRILLDLCGVGQPFWWGVPFLVLGAAAALVGASRAVLRGTLHAVILRMSAQPFGLAAAAIGVALCARGMDLPSVASRALAAAWLALVCHVLCRTLLLVCADATEIGAGTRRLDRLGGLVHSMPHIAWASLAGLFASVALPPGLGFAAFWLVFQSLLAAARVGDFGLQLLVAGCSAAIALSVGLAILAAFRLFAVAFLGRPRTPRGAVADVAPRHVRLAAGALAALAILLGLFPAAAVLPAIGWANPATAMSWAGLRTGFEAPGYASIGVAALLAIAWVLIGRALQVLGELRHEPAWSDGFAPAPQWLPFGDPATQYGPAGSAEPLHRAMARLPSFRPAYRRLIRYRRLVLRKAVALLTW